MLTGIRKLNIVPLRLTALVLLTVVIVTLLVACASSDEEDGSPNLTIQPDPGPDLAVSTSLVSDPSLTVGDSFTLNATVTNLGSEKAASTTLYYYRSTDSTISSTDTSVGTDSVSPLAASATSPESISLIAPGSAGAYYYGACVNSVSEETDTSNNCSAGNRVDVVVGGGGGGRGTPDLIISSRSVSDSSLATGASFILNTTVLNQGTGTAASTTLRYYRSTDSTISRTDTSVGTDVVRSLAASATSRESISLTAPSSVGTYYYGACVESVVGEVNLNNNCSTGVSILASGSSTGSIKFTLTDGCRDPGALQARFFGYVGTSTAGRGHYQWPGDGGVFTTNNARTTGESITVTLGESGLGIGVICFGAALERDTSHWGVGLDGEEDCNDCCSSVPSSGTSTFSQTLICN